MHYFRVTIAYKGTDYFGWQAQSIDTLHEERPTVEGTILNALKKISDYQRSLFRRLAVPMAVCMRRARLRKSPCP